MRKGKALRGLWPTSALVLILSLLTGLALASGGDCAELFERLTARHKSQKELRDLEKEVIRDFDDLFAITPPSQAATDAWNKRVISALENLPASQNKSGGGFTKKQIKALFKKLKENPAAKESCLNAPNKYDLDPSNQIGFCFGRAIIAHALAQDMGLSNKDVRKVWLMGGNMTGGGVPWSHHVALAVRGDNGKWFVIDTHEMDRAVDLQYWVEAFRNPSSDGGIDIPLLFATKADRFGPDSTAPLFPSTASPESYNGFFHEGLEVIRKDGQTLKQQLREMSK